MAGHHGTQRADRSAGSAADAVPAIAPSEPFRAATGLKYLAGFFGGGVALSALYAATGQGIPCPLRMLTGWECPLCGGTRLGSALLHGDLAAAFAYNPLIFLGLIGLTVVGVLWIVEAFGGPKIRPPARVGALLKRMTATRWLVAGLAVSVAYLLLRNLL